MSKDKNFDQGINLEKYQDNNNVSLRNMNIGLWLSEKRALFTRIIIIFLICLSAIFFIYSAYQFYIYYNDNSEDNLTVDNGINIPRNNVSELKIEAPRYFKSGDKYDLVAKVTNSNPKFSANFEACFSLGGQELTCANSFILPNETKYIFALGKEIKGDIKTLSYANKNLTWLRVDPHTIPNYESFYADRLNFAYSDINFYNIVDSTYNTKNNGNILEFKAKNLSAFSYYDVPLNIALFNGSDLISVNYYHLQNFLSGETRSININWPGDYSNVRVEIYPNLNILNEAIYLKYQGTKTS
jgi:hypothetical protein